MPIKILSEMLIVNNISKSYPQRGIVLNNLSLEIKQGDSISVKGPSGSGKTTLLNIIGLLDRPERGDVMFGGESILKYDPEQSAIYRNRHIGFVFQEHLLLPYLTVSENILLPLMAAKLSLTEYSEKKDASLKLMEQIGVADLAVKYPFQISGGEAQRVALVRALVNRPAILLADEPTGSLDRQNADNLGDILLQMNKDLGITLILATHSESLARKMSRQLRLLEGSVISDIGN